MIEDFEKFLDIIINKNMIVINIKMFYEILGYMIYLLYICIIN
jgi:hypothetical protein